MSKIVTRFAPSPTGELHIGSLRTALFAYLWAKKNQGQFRLRIEDTDQKREVAGATKHIRELLNEFGLHPDGEVVVQSENVKAGVYTEWANKLIMKGHAYLCFCTPERLEQLRKDQSAQKLPPRYDGLCREIDAEESERRREAGEPCVIRLRLPERHEVTVKDGIHGSLSFPIDTLMDTVLVKSDGFPTYHLANVVDDHLMGVTTVIRGNEWLPSLPIHVLLYEFSRFDAPDFYHLPLILNKDRSKLSKRQGDVSAESFLRTGYLKEALINYVAFLGWNPGDEREIFSLDELVHEFTIGSVHAAGAIFDTEKLDWFNAWYIRNRLATKPEAEIADALKPYLPAHDAETRIKVFTLLFERMHRLSDIVPLSSFLWTKPEYDPALLIFKKSSADKTRHGLQGAYDRLSSYHGEWTRITVDLELRALMEVSGLSFGDVFWPVRVALSGLQASPPPADIAGVLGKSESLSRIERALANCPA